MKKPELKAKVTLTLTDIKTGKVIKKRSFRSQSYVLAMLDILYEQMVNVAMNITDTGGTARSVGAHLNNFMVQTNANDSANGLVVGTGTVAVAITDTKLGTQITHGSTSGLLLYGAVTITAPATSGSTRSYTIIRTFTNNSGATITVKECGIYVMALAATYKFCAVRDLISGGQAVLNGQALTITYTIGVTV